MALNKLQKKWVQARNKEERDNLIQMVKDAGGTFRAPSSDDVGLAVAQSAIEKMVEFAKGVGNRVVRESSEALLESFDDEDRFAASMKEEIEKAGPVIAAELLRSIKRMFVMRLASKK